MYNSSRASASSAFLLCGCQLLGRRWILDMDGFDPPPPFEKRCHTIEKGERKGVIPGKTGKSSFNCYRDKERANPLHPSSFHAARFAAAGILPDTKCYGGRPIKYSEFLFCVFFFCMGVCILSLEYEKEVNALFSSTTIKLTRAPDKNESRATEDRTSINKTGFVLVATQYSLK